VYFNHPGAVAIDCDAPSYTIVQACRRLGFQNPEDVRWCHLSQVSRARRPRPSLFSLRTWVSWLRRSGPQMKHCDCAERLPELQRCTFTLLSARDVHLVLGQCPRCQTMYWKEA